MNIDKRSYHVFSEQGQNMLFDRSTGTVAEVSEDLYDLLGAIKDAPDTVVDVEGLLQEEGVEPESILPGLKDFTDKGFFQFIPVDHGEQEAILQSLLAHIPKRMQLLMAQSCNLGCRYCYAWRNGSNQLKTLMSVETARAAVDYLIKRSADRPEIEITFFGGEPMLNWGVIQQTVSYALERCQATGKSVSFEMITNGTLLTPEAVHYLAAHRFMLMVSIDGWEEMHNYNRPALVPNTEHAQIVANAQYANSHYKSQGLRPIKIRANMTHRFHDYVKIGDYLRSLGFERVAVASIEHLPHGDPSPAAVTEDDTDELMARGYQRLTHLVDNIDNLANFTGTEKEELSPLLDDQFATSLKGVICGIGRNTQTIDCEGNIYPCHRYEGMKAYILGNIYQGLDREKTLQYYRKVNGNATSRCHSCWIRDYCAGGCAWLLSSKSGELVDPTPRECDRRRLGFQRALYLRSKLRRKRPQLFAQSLIPVPTFSARETGDAKSAKTPTGVCSCGTGGCGS